MRAPRYDHQVGQPRKRQVRLSRISVSDLVTDRDALVLLVRSLICAVLPLRMAFEDLLGDQADRAISKAQLHALPRFHTPPIDGMVYPGSRGVFVLRGVSRLDAFSGYPVRT